MSIDTLPKVLGYIHLQQLHKIILNGMKFAVLI
jgi:hypothetical protein